MLETLLIKNFQAHTRLKLQLSPTVTTVVGPSDRGKSSILRALRWVCLNLPAGGAFIRHGASRTVVKLTVDGHALLRTKARGGENAYRLDGKRFVAFGAAVPEEVASLLGLAPAAFAGQHDPPFWLGETPGERGRQLNAVIDLGAVDRTLGNLDRMVRAAQARVEVGEERTKAQGGTRKALTAAEERSAILAGVEALEQAWFSVCEKRRLLADLVAGVSRYGKAAKDAAERKETALAAVRAGGLWERVATRRKGIESLVRQITQFEQKAAEARGAVREAQAAIRNRMGKECPLCHQAIPS